MSSFFLNLSKKIQNHDLHFTTKAIITKDNNNFNIKLADNKENSDIIQIINDRLEIYNKLYNINQKEFHNTTIDVEFQEIEKKYQEEINLLINKLDKYEKTQEYELNKHINKHNKINEENKLLVIELEKNKMKIEFNNKINKKDIEIMQLKQQLSDASKISNIEKTITNKLGIFHKYFDDKMITTQNKGIMGEKFLYKYFKQLIELSKNASIEPVQGQSNAGDLFLIYENMKCCVESKNHSGAIGSNELNRFLYTDVQNPNYNCGIFISHKSGFTNNSGINHFDIIIENNKPCIFLANIQDNLDDIKLALKIINFLLTVNHDVNKINIINQLKKDIATFKELEDINKSNIKNLNKSCKIITNKYIELENMLNTNSKKRKRD